MRISLALVRLLALANNLEAFSAFAAIAWSIGLLLGPGAHGAVVVFLAMVLVLAGLTSLVAQAKNWRRTRQLTSLMAFNAWGLLAFNAAYHQPDGFALGIGLFVALAFGELAIYVRILVALDDRRRQQAIEDLHKVDVREIQRLHHGQGTRNGSNAQLH